MDLRLKRTDFRCDGVFGILLNGDEIIADTLEHSYACFPKVPPGVYTCIRGKHQLAHMTEPFETFEIIGIPGHTNILFHVGNFNSESEGCVLLGSDVFRHREDQAWSLLGSRKAFNRFIELQKDALQFTLTVE